MSIKSVIIIFTIVLVAMANPQRIRTRATKVPALRVVGGEPGNIKDLPYQANILLHGQHFCGGSIISPKLILTAGHCVCEQMPSALKVITGSTYAGNGIMSDIGRIFCHEEYNKNEGDLPVNDIAILDLKIPLKTDDYQAVIPMYKDKQIIFFNEIGLVSGWGKTENSTVSYVLKKTNVPIVDTNECRQIYDEIKKNLPNGTFCAGWLKFGGHDSCQGDSGGPLVVRQQLAGIVSAGLECGAPNSPGVYTSVKYFEDWITSIMVMIQKEEDIKKAERERLEREKLERDKFGQNSIHTGYGPNKPGNNYNQMGHDMNMLDNEIPNGDGNQGYGPNNIGYRPSNSYNQISNSGFNANNMGRILGSNHKQMSQNNFNGYGTNNMVQRPVNYYNQINQNLNNVNNDDNEIDQSNDINQVGDQGYNSNMGQNVNGYQQVGQPNYQTNQINQNANNVQYVDQYGRVISQGYVQNRQCGTCNTGYYANQYYQQVAYNPYQQAYRRAYYPAYYQYYG